MRPAVTGKSRCESITGHPKRYLGSNPQEVVISEFIKIV